MKSNILGQTIDITKRVQSLNLWGESTRISTRLDDDRFILVTNLFEEIDEESLLIINRNDDYPASLLSTIDLHRSIYDSHKHINGIIHSHGNYIVKQSIANQPIIHAVVDDMAQIIGPTLKTILSITNRDGILRGLKKRNAILIKDMGGIAVGRSLWEAFTSVQVLEKSCAINIMADNIGGAKPIPKLAAKIMHLVYMKKYSKKAI